MTLHLVGSFMRSTGILLAGAALAATPACAEQPPSQTTTDNAANDDTAPRTLTVESDDVDVPQGDLPLVSLEPAFDDLTFHRPVQITHADDDTDRLFVLEQRGRVMVFDNTPDIDEADVFLDIRDRVFRGHNEEGLLSIAFHPDYENNRQFFLWYSAGERGSRRAVLSRFTATQDNPNQAEADSEKIILQVDQPWGNHNGGMLLFGSDGYLYASIGDGGSANDPHGHGQNLQTLLGTIIRIDVNNESDDKPYAIPKDNPFVDDDDARDEIWAYGLRNVWRMSFDRETGALWAGDVGQNAWEMVYVINRGENYGWNITEGSHQFRRDIEPDETLIDPVVEYSRRLGMSITGGHVYRGSDNESLQGAYVYADYVTGRMWALRRASNRVVAYREILQTSRRPHVTSFGEDEAGELYVCAFDRLDGRGSSEGRILRVVEY